MAKIVVTGAGSAQANGVINSLLLSGEHDEIIGLGSEATDLVMCAAHKKYLMPYSRSDDYRRSLLAVLNREQPNMIHFQHDAELAVALKFRDDIDRTGVKMLVPDYNTIDTCIHKYKSWEKFKAAGIRVPENRILHDESDLRAAFKTLGDENGRIWLRSMSIGGGGRGALPTNDLVEAREWIEKHEGWGHFIAAELLRSETVTWLSIWHEGDLVVAQGRRRKAWAHSALSLSGVTGVTKVGETCSDSSVDAIAMAAVKAVSVVPNGIYGVDMAYDRNGVPNPTEINISRFFTTIQFFTEAGLNMPKILRDLVLYGRRPTLHKKLNPLPVGLLWLRAMDCRPLLTTREKIENELLRPL